LGHHYSRNDFIKSTIESKLIGSHVPCALGKSRGNNEISTYDLTDGIKINLLIFSNNCKAFMNGLEKINKYPLRIVIVTKNRDIFFKEYEQNFILYDGASGFFSAFSANEGDIFLIRPDGYIGYISNLKHEYQYIEYFKYLFKG
jgi:hypothetical protein